MPTVKSVNLNDEKAGLNSNSLFRYWIVYVSNMFVLFTQL